MFGFFSKHKPDSAQQEKAEQKQTTEYATAPGTDIHYDPELIDKLSMDHQELLGLYVTIREAFEHGEYDKVARGLEDFRAGLQAHLLMENVKLYIYLDYAFKNDETNFELIRGFRKDMDGIAKVALKFIDKYISIGVDPELAPSFAEDFTTIGAVLTKRIEREESTLYPLYMQQY